jgi:hypothetical protein
MSFTSIGSFNSGLWKGGGSTNTVSGITVVNYYTEAYISWNAVRNATGYQVSVTGGEGGNSYTTANTYQLFTGLTDNTMYTISITAIVGGSVGPPKASSFTTLKLPYSSTVQRTISSNGIDSVWSFIDSTNILDFYIYSDICLNIILVGAGGDSSSSSLNNFQGGGGAQVIYLNQYRVYNYYNTLPTITNPYKANIYYQGGGGAAGWGIYLNSFITGFYFDVINFSGQNALNGLFTGIFTGNTNRGQESRGYKLVDMTANGNDVYFGPYSGGTSFSTTGGGGGGAGGVGGNATSGVGGNGGPGIGFTINNVAYGPYGGGGGGYGTVQSGTGKDGGGNGGINGNGVAYTGGGPGGSQSTAQQNRGGSGIVVIVGTTSLLPSVVSGLSYGNLVGNATTNSYSVDISYNQSVNNVTGYCIQFNSNVKNTTSGLTGNSFVFNSPTKLTNNYSGLNGNTAYTITAYTIGTYGNSAITNITIPQLTLPPTNLIGNTTTTTNNSISFSFTPPTTTVSSYIATAIDVSNSSLIYSNTITGNTTSATITGLASGNFYNISMKSINTYGISLSSGNLVYRTTVSKVATGGSTTTSGGYKIHTFTSNGTFRITSGITSISVLLVGGGGQGYGGGGGGGGYYNFSTNCSNTDYTISVGAGGSGGTTVGTGQPGGNSSIIGTGVNYTVGGGAPGVAGLRQNSIAPSNGGGGGGVGQLGSSTPGLYGFAGGNTTSSTNNSWGGGGGAGSAGLAGTNNIGGNGGNGIRFSINNTTYGGGGGGGGATRGSNGSGGGGNANTGGGGIGSKPESYSNGGSGIVIVYYAFP